MGDSSPQTPLRSIPDRDLLTAEAAFRALVDRSPVGALVSLGGRIHYINPRLAEILGLPPAEILGKAPGDLVIPEDRAMVTERFARIERDNHETEFQTRAQKKSGRRIFLELHLMKTDLDDRPAVVGTVLDVTERSLTVEHLNEQLEFISAITSNLGEGICAFDENGLVSFSNKAAEEVLGWMQYEMIAKPFHDFVHPDEARSDCPLKNWSQRVTAVDDEFRCRDGRSVPVSYTLSPVDGTRGLHGGVVIFHDISERKSAEESLRQSEQDYRGLFENARDAILIIDAIGEVVVEVNQRACDLYGFSHDEFVGAPLQTISTERSFAQLNLKEVLRNVGSLHFESVQLRKDGTEINVEVNASLLSYKGQPAILSINRDITERKRSEAEQTRLQNAIRKAALEWQTTFDSIASPIVIVGLDGRIARLNRAARDLAGRDYREVLGLRVEEVAAGEPWQMSAQQIRVAGETEPVKFCQVVDAMADKTWDLSVARFGGRGIDEERFIVIIRDVTEVVKMQETLNRTERMSAMGSLVAGVAHEVRNPLFGMSATLDAFEASFNAPEYGDYIAQFREQIDRLNSLMRGLLDYGKPFSPELVESSIENTIASAVSEASQNSGNVRVESVIEGELPQMMMDRTRMFQVFDNLIKNAIQHSDAGKVVTVITRPITVDGNPWIESTVLDRGSGFRLEDLPRVFEPFFTRRQGGTGLGLSIVQKIVEEHGGSIHAGNRPGGGAMMTVRFPGASPPKTQ